MGVNSFIYRNKIIRLAGHDDHIMNVIRTYNTFYEHKMLEYIQRLVSGGTFIDVGANIGNHTVFFSKFCDAKVAAFEPAAENLQYLYENVYANKVADSVVVKDLLVGGPSEQRYTLVGHDEANMGMVRAEEGGRLPSYSLDELCQQLSDIKLIKIDVEGMEMDVLKGAEWILNKQRPHIFVEGDEDELYDYLVQFEYLPVERFNHTPTYHFKYQPI